MKAPSSLDRTCRRPDLFEVVSEKRVRPILVFFESLRPASLEEREGFRAVVRGQARERSVRGRRASIEPSASWARPRAPRGNSHPDLGRGRSAGRPDRLLSPLRHRLNSPMHFVSALFELRAAYRRAWGGLPRGIRVLRGRGAQIDVNVVQVSTSTFLFVGERRGMTFFS